MQRQITFPGVDDSGDLVGEFRLRPWRLEPYAVGHGHLGYNVAHRHRRRGVATQALGILRCLAADYGLPVVAFDVHQDNDGSIADARANAGRIVHVEATPCGSAVPPAEGVVGCFDDYACCQFQEWAAPTVRIRLHRRPGEGG